MINNKLYYSVLGLALLTCLVGIFSIPLMDIDASQYASISRELLERKSWIWFYDMGADYLDKPPMLFWLSALSLKVFGIYDWAYRLPSFLFAISSLFHTCIGKSMVWKKYRAFKRNGIGYLSSFLFDYP